MASMLSRVADSLYWMSRYLERADHVARQFDVHLAVVLDQSTDAASQRRQRLVACLVSGDYSPPPISNDHELAHLLTFNQDNSNSIVRCIESARENARQIREQINSQMWEVINQMYWEVSNASLQDIWLGQPHNFYHGINQNIYRFQGIADSRMTHDQGWQFVQLGRFIERASETSDTVNVDFRELVHGQRSADTVDQRTYLDWVGLLRGCAAFEAYSKVYTADLQPRHILEFLLLNPEFPYSVHFAINMIQTSLESIGAMTDTSRNGRVFRLAGRLRAMLDYAQIDEVIDTGMGTYLLDIQQRCAQIHEAIYQTFITYPVEEKLAG
jgi:uncharacterized alpha-E superfamily protein